MCISIPEIFDRVSIKKTQVFSISEAHDASHYTHMLPQCQVLSKILKTIKVAN